jgi:SRSO17 transposase
VPLIKTFSGFFYSRSDSNTAEARAYLSGLMQGKRRAKNMERMGEHVADFDYQSVQNFISDSPWQHRPLMDEIARRASGLLGGAARSRLVVDDTGIQKKGHMSVGVARQYLGRLGKVENGQVAVCTSLAAGQQSTLTDIRLYLPQEWCENAQRCEGAGIPKEDRVFRSKAQLALQSVLHQRALGVSFDVVSMDGGYGSDEALLHELDRHGFVYVAEVHRDQAAWVDAPWHHTHSARPGRKLKKSRPSSAAARVDELAQQSQEEQWRRLKVRDSDQGWVEVNYLAQRVWVGDGQGDAALRWLLVWENPDESSNNGIKMKGPRRHYALSNAGADEDPRVLVGDALERNVVERNFRDAKSEVGMADYQTRGWQAWQHHMALVMLAMLFLTQEKMQAPVIETEEGRITITAGDITFLLERLLPQRGQRSPSEGEAKQMLEERIGKRVKDQVRRRRKTRETRPPLQADEMIPNN